MPWEMICMKCGALNVQRRHCGESTLAITYEMNMLATQAYKHGFDVLEVLSTQKSINSRFIDMAALPSRLRLKLSRASKYRFN